MKLLQHLGPVEQAGLTSAAAARPSPHALSRRVEQESSACLSSAGPPFTCSTAMAAPNWSTYKPYQLKSRSCACGWGCASGFDVGGPPDKRCLAAHKCVCGWQCIQHPYFGCRQGAITWTQALLGPKSVLRIRRFESAQSEYCLRLGDLAELVKRFFFGFDKEPPFVIRQKTLREIYEWFYWLALLQREADRFLARATSFNNAVTAARLSILDRELERKGLPPRPRSYSRSPPRKRR